MITGIFVIAPTHWEELNWSMSYPWFQNTWSLFWAYITFLSWATFHQSLLFKQISNLYLQYSVNMAWVKTEWHRVKLLRLMVNFTYIRNKLIRLYCTIDTKYFHLVSSYSTRHKGTYYCIRIAKVNIQLTCYYSYEKGLALH